MCVVCVRVCVFVFLFVCACMFECDVRACVCVWKIITYLTTVSFS